MPPIRLMPINAFSDRPLAPLAFCPAMQAGGELAGKQRHGGGDVGGARVHAGEHQGGQA